MREPEQNAESAGGRAPARTASPTPLGVWLKAVRTGQRLSQSALAERAGLSRSYVCNIERGYGLRPSIAALDKLAAALDVSRLDLLAAAGVLAPAPGTLESDQESRLLAHFRSLSPEHRRSGERYLRFLQAEEHRWSQPRLIDDGGEDRESYPGQDGPTLFDLESLTPPATTQSAE